MGMGDHDGVDRIHVVDRWPAIQIVRTAAALEHAAIHHNPGLISFDEIAGSGDLAAGSSIWGDFHDFEAIKRSINVTCEGLRGDVIRKSHIKLLPAGGPRRVAIG